MNDREPPGTRAADYGLDLLTMNEVADILRISPRTLRRYLRDGTIPTRLYSRMGGRPRGSFRFTQESVREIAGHIWSEPEPIPAPAGRPTQGMVPYRPRKRLS